MTDLEEFEAHIKSAAWYLALSEAAKADDEAASVFRMAKMAASEAWQASRRVALDKCLEAIRAERLVDHTGLPEDVAYEQAVMDCEKAIETIVEGGQLIAPLKREHLEAIKCGDALPDASAAALPADTVSRWVFDAFKLNLEALHALCLEFGCQQGDTVADWLRSRLTAQPPGYCIRHSDGLRWRTLDPMGMPDWTVNEAEALCFSLRHHADAFAGDDPEDVRIVPRAQGGVENGQA